MPVFLTLPELPKQALYQSARDHVPEGTLLVDSSSGVYLMKKATKM